MRYAAYGSNLHPLRLAERTPSAVPEGSAAVPGWELAFNKRGADGSGKCTLRRGAAGIWVAVYSLSASDALRLDGVEGSGYERAELEVPGYGACFTYLGHADYLDDRLQPYDWYRDLVLAGGRHHGFPARYLATLERLRCAADDDAVRRDRHAALLARLGGAAGL